MLTTTQTDCSVKYSSSLSRETKELGYSIYIDRKKRIFLVSPSTPEKELKLQPLTKALYLFFLRNPQGISLYDLPEYRMEMLKIYREITPYNDNHEVFKNVDRLLNRQENSFHEKCSRIKRTLSKHLPKHVLPYFCISGARGEAKRIDLQADRIKWE